MSERRLHPLSILFRLGGEIRGLLLPALLLLIGVRSGGGGWPIWMLAVFLGLSLVTALVRHLTFRYRLEAHDLVIRSGLLSRAERRIPWSRIQNLDGARNPVHRALDVVEARVDTGAGGRDEARLSVLSMAAFEELRARVLATRTAAAPAAEAGAAAAVTAADAPRELLRLSTAEIALFGLVHDRGGVLLAAAVGVLWEFGLLDGRGPRVGIPIPGGGAIRETIRGVMAHGFTLQHGLVAAGVIAGLFAIARLASVLWSLGTMHGFRLVRDGGHLRSEHGLFTRVTAAVPVRRIQALTLVEGPVHRLSRTVGVRIETAGTGPDEAGHREWLAPIIRRDALPALLREVAPGLDPGVASWQPVHPRAFGRMLRRSLFVAALLSVPAFFLFRGWGFAVLALFAGWVVFEARREVAQLAWAATPDMLLVRRGWWSRRLRAVGFGKIQSVRVTTTPFDRRAGMANLVVDTAGAGLLGGGTEIPFLARETADALCASLVREASRTSYRG